MPKNDQLLGTPHSGNTASRLPLVLLALYLLEFGLLAIAPYSRSVWWAENIPIVLIVSILVFLYRRFRFSDTAYLLMAVLICLHTIGGHYTFERVPFGFITDLFGFSRNHFDRVSHFSVGFYAYAIIEFIDRRRLSNSRGLSAGFGILAIFTVAAVYEIIEWLYTAGSNPAAGAAFLGSQGDIWDAQKDMLADGLGAIAITIFYWIRNFRQRSTDT
jgi:putative membrane protein